MPNRESFSSQEPLKVSTLEKFVQTGQIEKLNEDEVWLLSKEKIQNLLTTKADKSYFTKFIFNDESVTSLIDGYTYYGCTINHTVSSGTYYFCNCTVDLTVGGDDTTWGTCYFYNCTGALTVSGKTPTIYATNCHGLAIGGKTDDNWKNIWVDGVSNRQDGVIVRYTNGTMIISETKYVNTSGIIPYEFPVAFSAEPATTITGLFGSRYVTSQQQTATYIKFTVWDQSGQTNAEFVNIHAIGRWK